MGRESQGPSWSHTQTLGLGSEAERISQEFSGFLNPEAGNAQQVSKETQDKTRKAQSLRVLNVWRPSRYTPGCLVWPMQTHTAKGLPAQSPDEPLSGQGAAGNEWSLVKPGPEGGGAR